MVEAIRPEPPQFGVRPPRSTHPRYRTPPPVLQSIRQLSSTDIHGHRVSRAEMEELVEALQLAETVWDSAQAASENPPLDPGFPDRVRALADACERQAKSLGRAASVEGFAWTPLPDQRHMIVSHELRPGADRPGPAKLWQESDRAVQRLGIAMEGRIMCAVALQYRDLARPRTRDRSRNDRSGLVRSTVDQLGWRACHPYHLDHEKSPTCVAFLGEGERWDSNPRPPGPQPGALPTELRPPWDA